MIITSQSDLTWVQDPGITTRLVYLQFGQSINKEEVNPDLFSVLSSDMGWLIDMAIGMTQQRANKILMEIESEYKKKSTPTEILSILHMLHLEYGEDLFETTDNLYIRYSYICAEIGLKPMGKSSFSANLIQTIGLKKGIHLEFGRKKRARGVFGIRLIDLAMVENKSISTKETIPTKETIETNETKPTVVNSLTGELRTKKKIAWYLRYQIN